MSRRSAQPRTRYVVAKKKWTPAFASGNVELTNVVPFATANLAENSANTAAPPTATVIKVKNFKVNVDIVQTTATTVTVAVIGVFFVPERYQPTFDIFELHPEWCMGWRMISVSGLSEPAVQFSSRLTRNLNSGDRICLVVRSSTAAAAATEVRFQWAASYVACNN